MSATAPKRAPLLSVCIPAYEMGGQGSAFLKQSFDVLVTQTFTDFEVVVSDHSKNDSIKRLCADYATKLQIQYIQNTNKRGNPSANINNAITNARGTLLKVLFQDDFLFNEHSLQVVVDGFDVEKDHWLVTASEHSKDGKTFIRPFYPRYNKKMIKGINTISSPSVLTIKNDNPLLFDEQLTWLMDCDYYERYHQLYGAPKVVRTIAVVNRMGEHQVTNSIADEELRTREHAYVAAKFRTGNPSKVQLPNVTLVAVSSVRMEETVKALRISMAGVDFHDVVLVSHEKPKDLPKGITFKQCEQMTSLDMYSKLMAYDLASYIESDYALVIQHDGYLLRPEKWTKQFLEYDYIGAPWPKGLHFTNDGRNVRVGNGGFSLRSRKLMNALNVLKLPFADNGTGYFNEDGLICSYYLKELEAYGMQFAPADVAAKFSLETPCAESVTDSFGFHKNKKAIPRFFFSKLRRRGLL